MIPLVPILLLGVTLHWNANSEPDLAGYQVYWRTSEATNLTLNGSWTSVTNVGQVTQWQAAVEPNKFYYFAVTAYNAAGAESDYSTPTVFVIFVRPEEKNLKASLSIAPPPNPRPSTERHLPNGLAGSLSFLLERRTGDGRMLRTTHRRVESSGYVLSGDLSPDGSLSHLRAFAPDSKVDIDSL